MQYTARGILLGATYSANWGYAFTTHLPAGLAHLWSLAEEEQFYLLWPVALLAMLRRDWTHTRIAKAILIACGAAVIWRTSLWLAGVTMYRLYFGFDTHADGLLIGCLLGVLLTGGLARQLFRAGRPVALYAIASAATLSVLVFFPRHDRAPALTTFVFALCGGGLLCGAYAYRDRGAGRILALPALLWLGRRSYAFYLWHLPIKYVLDAQLPNVQVRYHVVAGFLLSLAAAEVSWRLVETPFLQLKSRFATPATPPTPRAEPGHLTPAWTLDKQ
jgi:peptidoglycan/LPS O-acetylase OafA/YrhL